tara:strand:+ start:721 stop:1209 length:489 start_codon:yes stop_codon:yes gene_type:complete
MRIFIFVLLIVNLYSCREATKVNPIIEDETEKDVNTQKNVVDPITQIDWSNPVLIGGASFGNIINVNYKLGEFNELYRLTNSALKSSLTKQEIVNKYRSLPLGFDLDFPMNRTEENGIIWLHYAVEINATKKIMRMPIVIEEDTCRLMLLMFEDELNQITSR